MVGLVMSWVGRSGLIMPSMMSKDLGVGCILGRSVWRFWLACCC